MRRWPPELGRPPGKPGRGRAGLWGWTAAGAPRRATDQQHRLVARLLETARPGQETARLAEDGSSLRAKAWREPIVGDQGWRSESPWRAAQPVCEGALAGRPAPVARSN